MSANTSIPVRLPVGSLIVVGPPGSGKTSILRAALTAAGLNESCIVCRDDLRVKYGMRCTDFAHRAVPAACMHHEEQVSLEVNAAANTFLAAGQTWLYDQTGRSEATLLAEVERAHRRGLAAVALRRRANDGSANVSLDFCLNNNKARARRVPDKVVEMIHASYVAMTPARLYEIGFDLVVEWDEHTTFELMPEGPDARHITAPLAIVGDIHGCARTFLDRMLPALGTDARLSNPDVVVVSVGDIHDKGQHSVEMIRWWLWALKTGRALMVDSNHNQKLVAALSKPDAPAGRGNLAATIADIEAQPDAAALKEAIVASFSRLPSHLVFSDVVVAHAAMTEDRLFRTDGKTRSFALFTRYSRNPWEWTGSQDLVHGHVVVGEPTRRQAPADPSRPGHVPGQVIAVDTGAFEGGGLTAYLTASRTTLTVPSVASDQIDPSVNAHMRAHLIARGIITASEMTPAELTAQLVPIS